MSSKKGPRLTIDKQWTKTFVSDIVNVIGSSGISRSRRWWFGLSPRMPIGGIVRRIAVRFSSAVKRGSKAYGEQTKMDREFLRADFDRRRQMGPRAVGQLAQVGDGNKLKQRVNAHLEGDDAS